MTELKLRQLHRGYVLTDFEGNEVGVKDSEQAIEEVKKLLNGGNSEKPPVEDSSQVQEQARTKKVKYTTVELHRKIFEIAKEQISVTGKTNGAEIARALGTNASNVSNHLKKMTELDELEKKWKDERDKKMTVTETRTDAESNTMVGDIKTAE
jgi:DNA-binding NarL/FixJ family response regulator